MPKEKAFGPAEPAPAPEPQGPDYLPGPEVPVPPTPVAPPDEKPVPEKKTSRPGKKPEAAVTGNIKEMGTPSVPHPT
ncbi:MAG: hypothetical protein M1553_03135, partial [Firmicutes bacterium]|nr:hypothetical protein [Bacillota bacterium]